MRGRRIFSAYGSSLLSVFSGLLTNLWFLKILTSQVGKEEFGVFAFILQITNYLSILQVGLDFATSRDIAENLGAGDTKSASDSFWILRRFNRNVMLLCLAVTVGLCAAIPSFGLRGWSRPSVIVGLTFLMGLSQAVGFLQNSPGAVLIGSHRQWIVNSLGTCRTIATTLLAYTLLKAGAGIFCIAIAEVATNLVMLAALWYFMSKHCGWARRRAADEAEPSRSKKVGLLKFGTWITLGGIAWTIESTCDVFFLGTFCGPAMVAVYVLWWRFPSMIFGLGTNLTTAAYPSWAEGGARGDGSAKSLLSKVGLISLGFGGLAMLGIGLWLPPFVRLWLGGGYMADHAGLLAVEMGGLIFLRLVGNLLSTFGTSLGMARLTTTASVVQMLIKLVFGFFFCRAWGLTGLMAASLLSSLFQCASLSISLGRIHMLGRGLALSGAFLGAVSLAAAVGLGSARFGSYGVKELSIGIAATILAWGLIWTSVAMVSGLRDNLLRLLRIPAR